MAKFPTDTLARAAARPPLVVRCGAFGDMVLITALLAQLRERLGRPVDVITAGAWSRPLLQDHPDVHEVFLVHSRKTPYWLSGTKQRLVRWLRERGPGPTWFCDASRSVRDLLSRAGIPDEYVCDTIAFEGRPREHFCERWVRFGNCTPLAFTDMLPHAASNAPPAGKLAVSGAAELELEPWLQKHGFPARPVIVVQAGNKRTMRPLLRKRPTNTKYWPETHWVTVIRGLRERSPEAAIVLLGVKAEWSLNEEIAQLAGVRDVFNVADDMPVRLLIPLLKRAQGMVSVDTGPAHAAAALGCPTVTLFGVADPVLFRPGGVTTPAITLTGEVAGVRSMLGIQPRAVLQAWDELQQRQA